MEQTNTEEIKTGNSDTCFVIHLKNKTDEKLFNVELFNFNHKEQDKIEYRSFYPDYDYVLRQLAGLRKNDELQVTKIHFSADCDYSKFAVKQVKSEVELVYTSLNGTIYSTKRDLALFHTADQVHHNIVILPFEHPITLSNQLQFKLQYLMPETELTVTVFYKKNKEE
jgi:hypothetical protein